MDFKNILINKSKDEYGEIYQSHVLEIYKIYLEMGDKISTRREKANSFFLALNTAVIGLVGYANVALGVVAQSSRIPITIAGIVLSYLWYRMIRSHKDLNSAKFRVLHAIESFLPLRPYDAEWEAVGRGKNSKLYLPFTHIEIIVPWIFIALHLYFLIIMIPFKQLLCR